MRVLITGGSGFIGAHIAKNLIARDHHVALLATSDDPLSRLRGLEHCFETIKARLEDEDILKKLIEGFKPEACIHMAWYVKPGNYLDSEENIKSLKSSLILFQMLINAGCSHIVAAGTCFEYDTQFGYLHENTPTKPVNIYGAAKLSCCLVGEHLAANAKIAFAWGRIFYPYGPLEDKRRLVPSAIQTLLHGQVFQASRGNQIRDYIHVTDVASAFTMLMERKAEGVFNISSGVPVSIRQLLEILGRLLNRGELIQFGALPDRAWDPPFICGDNSCLRNLGWAPSFPLEQGLGDTVHKLTSIVKDGTK
jgi:nucleoside-diphosphate-sugar epimerase